MPYVQHLSETDIHQQLYQWQDVMHDPRIDGFNGWACKQKIYKLKFLIDDMIKRSPHYAGENEWVQNQKLDLAQKKLSGQ